MQSDVNNRIEHDHRGIKQRPYPVGGLRNFNESARFCRAFDEQRQDFRRPNVSHHEWSKRGSSTSAGTELLSTLSAA